MEEPEKPEIKGEKKIAWITIGVVVLIFVVTYFVTIGLLVSFSPALTGKVDQNKVVQKTISLVPYPAVMVGGKFISDEQLLANLASVQRFYENQDFSKLGLRVDFSTEDGKKRLEIKGREVLDKLIENAVIQSEAERVGINLTPDVISQEVDRSLKTYGAGDTLQNNLQKLYGWNMDDFKKNIVEPDLYKERLAGYIQKTDPTFAAAKNKITAAQTDLANGMSFADAVKKYSEGASASAAGELGWFSASQMLPEVALAAFNLNAGQQSEIIQSGVGYHIVRVEDKKLENNVPMIKVSQIFVKTESFSEWLAAAEKKYRIVIFSKEFRWNSQSGTVEFRSPELQSYEKNMENNPPNDPSVIF